MAKQAGYAGRMEASHDARCTFNHGFHDAAWDVKNGTIRELVADGPHTPKTVSLTFSRWYYAGYQAGILFAQSGLDTSHSEDAWQLWTQSDPAARACEADLCRWEAAATRRATQASRRAARKAADFRGFWAEESRNA